MEGASLTGKKRNARRNELDDGGSLLQQRGTALEAFNIVKPDFYSTKKWRRKQTFQLAKCASTLNVQCVTMQHDIGGWRNVEMLMR